jgi:hypothetical protein
VHLTTMKSYVAPIVGEEGSVAWPSAKPLDTGALDMRAVPEPHRRVPANVPIESFAPSEEAFKQFVAERERLTLWSNQAFALYSEPGESREAFLDRCREEAERRIEEETERLEGTFRRRIDQVKERSERDVRDIDEKDQPPSNVAWGQATTWRRSRRSSAPGTASCRRSATS